VLGPLLKFFCIKQFVFLQEVQEKSIATFLDFFDTMFGCKVNFFSSDLTGYLTNTIFLKFVFGASHRAHS